MPKEFPYIKISPQTYSESEIAERAKKFYELMDKRRTVRDFSDKAIPREVMEDLIMAGSTAPSGANKQPWTFCLVGDIEIKKQIRAAAEKEEFENYQNRMSDDWLEDLAPLGTDWNKPFLEIAPWLVVVFKKAFDVDGDRHRKNYYVNESVGLACGFFLAAAHQAGLVALTHTPSPMNFLTNILNRPENERPFLLIPVGYPPESVEVPDIARKSANEIIITY